MDTPDLSKPPVTPQYFDQAQEVDTENIQLERGGAVGTVKDWATELKNRFYGSQIMDPFMRMVGKDPSKYMAGGGLAGMR